MSGPSPARASLCRSPLLSGVQFPLLWGGTSHLDLSPEPTVAVSLADNTDGSLMGAYHTPDNTWSQPHDK